MCGYLNKSEDIPSTMDEVRNYMETLGFSGDETLTMKECRRMFKRKSIAMLPEKHPTVPNAHSRFEEINTAFVEVRNTINQQKNNQ